MKKVLFIVLIGVLSFCFMACEETEEGVDDENDIIVRNWTEWNLWIMIDGSQRGEVENDGVARTVWDNIADGVHDIEAYINNDYTDLYCAVSTDYLNEGEDFNWYLYENGDYGGTKDGDCD